MMIKTVKSHTCLVGILPGTLLGILFCLSLTGCSTPSETFDCKAGTGVGCKSISEVNQMVDQMVDQGTLQHSVEKDLSEARDRQSRLQSFEAESLSSASIESRPLQIEPFQVSNGTFSSSSPLTVQRMPEEYLRVWVAPFQDPQGNFHESTVIYTVLKPGHWALRAPESDDRNG